MKDFFGQELAVGDTVAFEQPKYRNLVEGKITAFTPKNVRIAWTNTLNYVEGMPCVFLTSPCTVIKRPDTRSDTRSAIAADLHLYDVTIALIEYSSKWLNDSTLWAADEHLGPMWQALYDRHASFLNGV